MKFKAKISTSLGVSELLRMVGTFSKLSKSRQCRLRLTPTDVHLVFGADLTDSTMRVWSNVKQERIFSAYSIESMHEENEILLGVNLDYLSRALKSAATSMDVALKLTKRQDTRYLSMHIQMVRATVSRPIIQDIPVEILPADDIASAVCPSLPMPEVNVYLPSLKVVRSVVDRMKAISDTISISANCTGDLQLKVETSAVSVKTYFKGLENPPWGDASQQRGTQQNSQDSELVECWINVRPLYQYLNSHQIPPRDILLSIAQSEAVILYVSNEESSLICYIPIRNE